MSAPAEASPEAPEPESTPLSRALARLRKPQHPLLGVALTLPVFLVYHLGILVVPQRSGVDLVSSLVLWLLQASVPAYVIVTFTLTLALCAGVWIAQKRGALPSAALFPVLIESGAWALTLLLTVGWATHRLSRTLDSAALQTLSVLDKIVLAAGAGFHEELLFRALFLTGGAVVVERTFRLDPRIALGLCFVASSVAFSLAHHFGPLAEPFVLQAFSYRVLAGAILSGLYLMRGFAVAVYTHAFYSALVFFVYA